MRFICSAIVCVLFCVNILSAQTNKIHAITFHPMYGESKLEIDSSYKLGVNDNLQIEALKFYISSIELLDKGKVVWKEDNSFHLIDISNQKTLTVLCNIPSTISYDQVKFNLGIDSLTNVSGAMGGDLDPTKGMYWTWQSGYINFKLEGKSNVCKTRLNEFQLHLGGYQSPFNTLRSVVLDVAQNERADISIDIKQLLKTIDLSTQHHIMSPGAEAILVSENAIKTFSIQKN